MASFKNGMDPFEQRIKDSLDQYEVPYNSADWANLERAMSGGKARVLPRAGLIAGLLLGGLIVGGTTWYLMADKVTEQGQGSVAQAEQEVIPTPTVTTAPAEPQEPAPGLDNASGTTTVPGHGDVSAATGTDASAHTPKGTTDHPVSGTGVPANTNGMKASSGTTASVAPGRTAAPRTDEAIVIATTREGCSGNTITFKVENMPANGIYLWNFGDGSFSNKPDPEHVFSKPGRYQVMLSMSAPGVGTIHNKPTSDVITINEVPKAAFHVMKQDYDGHIPSVHFENRSMGGTSYRWDFGDGITSTIAHPDHVYKKKGVYQAELIVTNASGCEDKTIREVRVDRDYNLDAPATFSPNGDGNDDTFIPVALRDLGVEFTLMIYDTEGTLLYQTSDATKPWLGKPHNRGDVCNTGEYVWVADIRESLHLSETFTGKVKLTP